MSQEPVEYAPVSLVEEPRARQRPSTRFLISLPLILGFVGALLAGAWGLAEYLQSPSGFGSEVVLSITPKDPSVANVNHAVRIKSLLMIEQCLYRDGGRLKHLRIFDDTPHDQITELIKRNLAVESLTDDGSVISVRFVSADDGDTPTILNNLVKSYEESLIRRSEVRRSEVSHPSIGKRVQLRKQSEQLQGLRDVSNAKIRKLQDQINSSLGNQGLVQGMQKQIQASQFQLRKKNHLKEQIEKALEGDQETQADMVWILRERGHLTTQLPVRKKQNDAQPENAEETTAATLKILPDDSTEQTTVLRRFSRLIEGEIKALRTDIAEDTMRYQRLDAESSKVLRIKQELAELRAQTDQANAELSVLNRDLTMNHPQQLPSVWDFERLEVAKVGKFMSFGSMTKAMRSMMLGLLGGLLLGSLFAMIIK